MFEFLSRDYAVTQHVTILGEPSILTNNLEDIKIEM